MKLTWTLLFCCGMLFAGCKSDKAGNDIENTGESSGHWTKDNYTLEELLLMFQNWIPEEQLNDHHVWVSQAVWQEYKITDPKELKVNERFDPTHNEVRGFTPAIYMFNMMRTIDDRDFFSDAFYEVEAKYPVAGREGDSVEIRVSSNWYEAMVVNYSEEKCARLMGKFGEKYVNDDKMKPEWVNEKERWLEEMKKIAEK